MTPKRTITKPFLPFKEWEKTAVCESTNEFGREWMRDVYQLPNGKRVFHETHLPRSIFKTPSPERAIVDFAFMKSILSSLKEQGIDYLDDNYYTEEGYGLAVFEGKGCLERAYNFCMNKWKD